MSQITLHKQCGFILIASNFFNILWNSEKIDMCYII